MKNAKRALAAAIAVLLAISVLCACGKRKGGTCEGDWVCKSIPVQMQFKEITLNISGDSFTYTLTGDKTSTIAEGHCIVNGNDSMVLYPDKQRQINNADKKVLNEKTLETSESEAQPVYVKLDKSDCLTLTGGDTTIEFERK